MKQDLSGTPQSHPLFHFLYLTMATTTEMTGKNPHFVYFIKHSNKIFFIYLA
jgi:hypothetical protein